MRGRDEEGEEEECQSQELPLLGQKRPADAAAVPWSAPPSVSCPPELGRLRRLC